LPRSEIIVEIIRRVFRPDMTRFYTRNTPSVATSRLPGCEGWYLGGRPLFLLEDVPFFYDYFLLIVSSPTQMSLSYSAKVK